MSETTRLAPSPTGALHLGNIRTFLINWAMARNSGWRIVLRIEDLDTPRVKAGAADRLIETLAWLGLDWDDGPVIQSDDLCPYREAVARLAAAGAAYPCELTRREIDAAASAPHDTPGSPGREPQHGGEGIEGRENRFPPELRPPLLPRTFSDEATNWRFATPGSVVRFSDRFRGEVAGTPAETIGDFVIWTKRGQPSYQLAVVVDDARQGITQVVRGDDLLDSAGRQILLYRALGLAPEPAYTHLPLVVGPDGRRLAKRHGDTRIDAYRQHGVGPDAVIGLAARWSGIVEERTEMSLESFAARYDLSRTPRSPVVFTPEDHAWLMSRAR
jgi:glutamyl-tRNA synthetase